ncbi:MAG: gliding motility-associated C-terminal domain-containing protein [Candidatus Latescibacterota bacterium]
MSIHERQACCPVGGRFTAWIGLGALLTALLAGAPAFGQLSTIQLPGNLTWKDAQQPPFNPVNFFESVDFKIDGGIAPLDTTKWFALPEIPEEIEVADDFDFFTRQTFDAFTRHVSRDSVFALSAVVVDGSTLVPEGDLLLSPLADFPHTVAAVRQFQAAGIDSLQALVNLGHAVLGPRDPQVRFENWLRSPTIYERQLNNRQKRDLLEALIDEDPINSFRRVDGQNRPVEKRAVVIIMDLTRQFPIGLIRFYPRPEDNPIPISGYKLEIHDGVTYKRGQEEEVSQGRVGANYLILGGKVTLKEGSIAVFRQLAIEQSNTVDTVAFTMDPPRYMQQFKFRSLTGIDFDIAEFEVFNQGYPPTAAYLSKPLPLDPAGIDAMQSYLEGDLSRRPELDRLQGGTLGRITWDEEKIGDPDASSVTVSIQTGFTPEPLILIRLNSNGDQVEWRPNAIVVDHREGSTTEGTEINLDDPLLRAAARDIWNALSPLERADAQTTFPEYSDPTIVAAANKRDRQSNDLPRLPDPVFWSGYQPVQNGRRINVPGERPFFQFRVEFTSTDPVSATSISNLRIEQLFPPILQAVIAEIVPAAEIAAGRDTVFTYALRPFFSPGDPGFNRIRIPTPTAVSEVLGVEFAYGRQTIERSEAVAFETIARNEKLLVLGIPRVQPSMSQDDSLVVLVKFRGRVLNVKTNFTGHVFLDTVGAGPKTDYSSIIFLTDPNDAGGVDTMATILPQRVLEGDVLSFTEDMADRNTLDVVTSVALAIEAVVKRVSVEPNPFTPNGDGINDAAQITYDILRVVEQIPVTIEIYDLSGRAVRRWTNDRAVGSFSEAWDGTDDEDNLVPPGLYLMKLTGNTDDGDVASTRVVSVVY